METNLSAGTIHIDQPDLRSMPRGAIGLRQTFNV